MSMILSNLPVELIQLIELFLDVSSRFSLSRTSKYYARRASDQAVCTNDMYDDMYDGIFMDAIRQRYTNLFVFLTPGIGEFFDYYTERYCVEAAKSGSFAILIYIHSNNANNANNANNPN